MGLFDRPVTDKELRDFRRGKPVREAVVIEAAKRNGGSRKAARAIRGQAKRVQGHRDGLSQAERDAYL